MLVYRGVAPRRDDPDAAGTAARRRPRPRRHAPHDAPRAPAPQIVDITLYLDDYKAVDGVMLPHHMARFDRRQASRRDDVQDHQDESGLQAGHVRGEVGEGFE